MCSLLILPGNVPRRRTSSTTIDLRPVVRAVVVQTVRSAFSETAFNNVLSGAAKNGTTAFHLCRGDEDNEYLPDVIRYPLTTSRARQLANFKDSPKINNQTIMNHPQPNINRIFIYKSLQVTSRTDLVFPLTCY